MKQNIFLFFSDTGSYVITQITERLRRNINGNNDKYLNEILDEIQEHLHERGKQLMVKIFNNKTEKIKFYRRELDVKNMNIDKANANNEDIEQVQAKGTYSAPPEQNNRQLRVNDFDNENAIELMQQMRHAL